MLSGATEQLQFDPPLLAPAGAGGSCLRLQVVQRLNDTQVHLGASGHLVP